MIIVKAILKHKIYNFELVILQLCNTDEIINREDHFIKTLLREPLNPLKGV
jgi:hypothetical protein